MKKLLSLILLTTILFSNSLCTSAANVYTEDNTVDIPVTVIVEPSWVLTLPATVALTRSQTDYDVYDYFIGMDDENLRDMKRIFHGDPDQKCSLLMDYTANPRPVADPWYTRDFQRTWDDVQEGCRGLLDVLRGDEDGH